MALASLGLEISIFCDLLLSKVLCISVLLLNAILGLDFLGLALSRLQVPQRVEATGEAVRWTVRVRRWRAHVPRAQAGER